MTFQLTHPTRSATSNFFVDTPFKSLFQLTHPTRSATWRDCGKNHRTNFNSRTPRGVRLGAFVYLWNNCEISTHAPHAECDRVFDTKIRHCTNFNSRTPRGVRRKIIVHREMQIYISTHAPHAECDDLKFLIVPELHNFNSRTPRGVRQTMQHEMQHEIKFQLTHPTRSATEHRHSWIL